MKILFVLHRPKYVTTYEPSLRLLAERGHRIHFTFSRGKTSSGRKPFVPEPVGRLADDFPGAVTWDEHAPTRDAADGWFGIAHGIRVFGDFWRYLHPRYADAPLLKARVATRAQGFVEQELPRPLARIVWRGWWWLATHPRAGLSDALLRLARDLERAVPPSERISAYISEARPDVVLVTPLVDVASSQPEFLKSATALGIPCAICVNSWDNLTNKGVIRSDADAVFLWNDVQKTEAVELHGVPADRVFTTGAQKFDPWFERRPSLPADEFRARVGLDPARPYVLYVCSSRFIGRDETQFVERWLAALRADVALRDIGVLVRPHPENGAMWRDVDLSRFGDVAVYPPEGAEVSGEQARSDFFDSLYHSAAVVGINTSVMIEAAIVGKDVHSILADEFRNVQEGTLHFHYLLHENGGILRVARSLEEHVPRLAQSVSEQHDPDVEGFVASFIRPHGLDRPAAPILADAIERLAAQPPRPPVETRRARVLRGLLTPVAMLQRRTAPHGELGVIGLSGRVIGKQLELELAPLRRRSRVVVGPWLGDPAEEILYWIPYVRHLVERLRLDPSRLVAVSNSGVSGWYDGLCGAYVDLESLLDPEQLQRARTGWLAEREEVRLEVLGQLGVTADASVPTATARRLFASYRNGRTPLEVVLEFTDYRLLPVTAAFAGGVAVEARVLAGKSNDDPVMRLVAALGNEVRVVGGGASRADDAAVVAGARLLIASPGGLAALGVFSGVTTIGVREDDTELHEPDAVLLLRVAQLLGGAYCLLDRSQMAFLSRVAGGRGRPNSVEPSSLAHER